MVPDVSAFSLFVQLCSHIQNYDDPIVSVSKYPCILIVNTSPAV